MLNTSRCSEIEKRFPGLIRTIVGAYQLQSAAGRRLRNGGKLNSAKRTTKKK
jgi:hypothetical protein